VGEVREIACSRAVGKIQQGWYRGVGSGK